MTQNVNTSKKNTSKKAKAILAGGLVLGVGAAVTLASWTDEQWANASFSSGNFGLESSVDGDTFKSHASLNDAAKLKFDLPAADALGPGEKLAAPFFLRLNDETTHDARVTVAGPQADDIGLEYAVARVDSVEDCSSTAAFKATTNADWFDLSAGESGTPGSTQILCFHVKASEDLAEGQTAKPAWTLAAESLDRP